MHNMQNNMHNMQNIYITCRNMQKICKKYAQYARNMREICSLSSDHYVGSKFCIYANMHWGQVTLLMVNLKSLKFFKKQAEVYCSE